MSSKVVSIKEQDSSASIPDLNPEGISQLRSFVKRIENLENQKTEISEDIKEVYSEAKSTGFDVKIIRKCVTLRRKNEEDRNVEEQMLDLYMAALGASPN